MPSRAWSRDGHTSACERDHGRQAVVQTGAAPNLGRKADPAAVTPLSTMCRNECPRGRGHRKQCRQRRCFFSKVRERDEMTWDKASNYCGRALLIFSSFVSGTIARADSIFMKNGMVYRSLGQPDKDGTLVYLWDGLKK